MLGRFNIRVYGLWLTDGYNAVLVSEEQIRGRKILKFPGGGLEWGEGLADGLRREWKEELSTDIEIIRHFYTTDFFQPSAFDNSQVISIYYLVKPLADLSLPYYNEQERFYFLPVDDKLKSSVTLPIDKLVAEMLL